MSKLYIVATPIGNLSDLTQRAITTLKEVDYIACEDTRVTSKLLARYEIKKSLLSYFQHSKLSQIDKIINLLKQGNDIALVTDAGTPGIADPGNKLVAEIVKNGIDIVPIPGPSAMISALSISGLPTDEFTFFGFLPHKKGRQTKLKQIIDCPHTSVVYESVHRITKFLKELQVLEIGDRQFVLCRELTKQFETIYRGTVDQVLQQLQADTVKGEFVIIIE